MTEDNPESAPQIEAEAGRSRVALKVDIVVIGAGQAGLSSAYHLRRLGLVPDRDFVVVDHAPRSAVRGSSAGRL